MFQSARFKLTAWYLVIIMTISLLFSFAIYTSITAEYHRFEKMQVRVQEELQEGNILPFPPPGHFIRVARPDPAFIQSARDRLLITLVLINLGILGFSGAAGYFLAGRTLKPIQKMVDEQKRFVTDASHELRTPLTSLRSEIEVGLRNKNLHMNDAKRLLESNLEEVINLQTLSDNLLELAQNGRFVDPKNFEKVSLKIAVKNAIKRVEPLAKSKEITIVDKIGKHIIYGIPDRIVELFVILLDNAIKYSSNNKEVTIASQANDKQVAVEVRDQGIGIAEADLVHIFERFYRVSKSRTKTTASGYGLGLSIAKKIVAAHNGIIVVESKLGKGSIFKLVFRSTAQNKNNEII